MYWKSQEKVVFHIVFLIVFVFQVSSLVYIKHLEPKLQILLIAFNALFLYGMIMYAKWAWKNWNIGQAILKTLITEGIFILFFGGLFLIAKLTL